MKVVKNIFYVFILLICLQSCLIINNINKQDASKSKNKAPKNQGQKILKGSGEFVDLKHGSSEIFFTDNLGPKGYISVVDSIASDSLVRIVVKDSL
tara:strand:- start:166 stop:453 length:288 start_codon:yes stop_codon:yes gene_type:complete